MPTRSSLDSQPRHKSTHHTLSSVRAASGGHPWRYYRSKVQWHRHKATCAGLFKKPSERTRNTAVPAPTKLPAPVAVKGSPTPVWQPDRRPSACRQSKRGSAPVDRAWRYPRPRTRGWTKPAARKSKTKITKKTLFFTKAFRMNTPWFKTPHALEGGTTASACRWTPRYSQHFARLIRTQGIHQRQKIVPGRSEYTTFQKQDQKKLKGQTVCLSHVQILAPPPN